MLSTLPCLDAFSVAVYVAVAVAVVRLVGWTRARIGHPSLLKPVALYLVSPVCVVGRCNVGSERREQVQVGGAAGGAGEYNEVS